MAIKINQRLAQTQSLVMTPQLQQAIKLLTLTHMEMTEVISSEMVENPVLEEMNSEISIGDVKKEVDHQIDRLDSQNKEATADSFESPDTFNGDDFDWNKYIDSFNTTSSSPPSMASQDFDELPNYENIVSREMSLSEHLEWQLRMETLSQDEWKIAYEVIHNINDEGYLELDFEEILAKSDMDPEDAYEVLYMIQNLDPVGCGARNFKDCLMIQARALAPRLPLVEKIIDQYLDLFQKRDFEAIGKKLGVPRERIVSACEIIMSFTPKPGRLISCDDTHYVVPDIYVYDRGGELSIKVNDEGVPKLRISNLYKSMLDASNDNEEAKAYVEEKLKSALWLIKSIQNRQSTIYKVAHAIVKHQPMFFKKGSEYLKPMILKDIANEIGVHESTVSRVTTNKYMYTPLGIYELKYFFNTGIGGKNGGIDVASEALKAKIKELIKHESTRKPLSDQKIADLLSREDIKVARRTVAKYREQMNILPSSKRKRVE